MRRLFAAFLVVIVVAVSLVSSLEAQQRPRRPPTGGDPGVGTLAEPCGECEPGGDTSPPEIMLTLPGAITYSAQPTIQLLMCDNINLDLYTRQIKVNGVVQTSAFTGSYPGGCMASMAYYTATTLTLNMGTNTVWAYVCDFSSNCTQETFYITRQQGPPPIVSLAPYNPDIVDYGRCAMSCFAATYAQSTVPFYTMDTPRNVTLAYNSATVDPKPFVHADVTHGVPDSAGTLPQYFVFKVRYGSTDLTFLNGETALRFTPQLNTTMRMGGQLDASQLGGTGVYPITVIVGAQYSSGYYETTVATRLVVVDNTASFIARGWSIAEIQRAHIQGDGSVLIVSGDGSATYFQKSGSTYITPNGEFSRLTLAGGVYERTYYADSSRVRFGSTGLMGSLWDRFGNVTYVFHDGSNRVSQIREPSPMLQNQNLAYGSYGLSSITALSRTTNFTVNNGRQLTSITDPDNISTGFGYVPSSDSLLETITNRAGASTTVGYNPSSRRLAAITAPAVQVVNADGTVSTAAPVTQFASWQQSGVPYASTNPTAFSTLAASQIVGSVIDPDGHAVTMRVDRFGQAVQAAAPLGDTVTVTFNASGLPTQVVPRLGVTSSLTYDATGFMTSSTAGGVTMSARKGGFAQVADSVWGQGPAQRLFINTSNGRVDSARVGGFSGPASAQNMTRYTYNTRGQLLTVRDNDSVPDLRASHIYDSYTLNPIKDSVASGAATTYHQDGYGRTDQVTTDGLPTRSVVYDVMNRVIRQYDGVNANPTYFYYGPIVLDSIRDPRGQLYQFRYNTLGWLTHRKDPTGAEDSTFYNRRGLERRYYNRLGQYVEMNHDSLRRVTSRSGAVTSTTFTYSANGLILTSANSTDTVKTYLNATHRQPDSVVTVIQAFGGTWQTYKQTMRYTAQGWMDSTAFRRGGTAFLQERRYRWRANVGVLDSLRFGNTSPWTRFTYSPSLNALVTRFSSTDSILRVHSETHQLSLVQSYPNFQELYGYNARGQATVARTGSSGNPHRVFGYDSLGRLTSSKYVAGGTCLYNHQTGYNCSFATVDSTHGFSYDQVGNRTDHGGSFATGNRITGFDSCSYDTYVDGADSLRTCGSQSAVFTWSADGQLTGYTVGGLSHTFGYDPLGRLVRRSVNGSVKSLFLWHGDNLVAELDSVGTSRRAEYFYYPGGLDNLYAIAIADTNRFAHTDAMGNVRALTNGNGQLRRTYAYDEWGQLQGGGIDSLPSSLSGADRARFKGALWLGPELDIYYMRYRWYEPRSGRFLSEDPIGLAGGINPYVFGEGDPINSADPTGLMMDMPSNDGPLSCWSELCQAAWNGGGGGDWDGNGVYDYDEFADYGFAVVVVAAALRRLGVRNVTAGEVVRSIEWIARTTDWGACCQQEAERMVARLLGRGGVVPGNPTTSIWGETENGRITLTIDFWLRSWAKKYNGNEFRDTFLHEFYHYVMYLAHKSDPRVNDFRAACFASSLTGYVSLPYFDGQVPTWYYRECAR